MARAEPFPFAALPQLSRAEARSASIAARGIPGISLGALAEALVPSLGAAPVVTPYPLETWPPGSVFQRPEPTLVAVVLGDGVASPASRWVLELDPTLAGYAVDRGLGASAPEPRLAPGPATDGERGTLAYLAATALAQAQRGGPIRHRVLGVITTAGALFEALGGEAGVIFGLPARVELAGIVGWARLFLRPSAVSSFPSRPLDAGLMLDLSIRAARATLSATDVAALGVGDVLVPDAWTARPDAGGRHWTGELVAQSPAGGPTLVLAAGASLVLSRLERGLSERGVSMNGAVSDQGAKGSRMTEQRNHALAAEVPVEVSIEIGRLQLTVGELADLVPGAVLVTGIAVGQPLVLRVGTKVIGRGEMVVVDGELGVKLRELG